MPLMSQLAILLEDMGTYVPERKFWLPQGVDPSELFKELCRRFVMDVNVYAYFYERSCGL